MVNWQNLLFILFHQSRSVLSPNPIIYAHAGGCEYRQQYAHIFTYVYGRTYISTHVWGFAYISSYTCVIAYNCGSIGRPFEDV